MVGKKSSQLMRPGSTLSIKTEKQKFNTFQDVPIGKFVRHSPKKVTQKG